MKTIVKILSMALVLIMAASLFSACGGKDGSAAKSDGGVKGDVKTRNGLCVLVPDGYEFVEEGIYVDALVRSKDNTTKYVQLNKFDTVEEATESMDINIGDTPATEVEFELNGVKWEGKQYEVFEDWYMCDVIATIGDTVIFAHASEFDWEDDTYRAIMESITVEG